MSEDAAVLLNILRTKTIGDCRRCPLCKERKNIVFGVGSPLAKIMFVGEGPGAQEDEKGEPFVGRAGELLDNMIEAMHLRREDVYIGNTVKCRPPGNRDPEKEEMDACAPFLAEQIHIIQPRAIVALGRVAARWFFPDIESIIAERGKWRQWPLAGPMFPMTGGDAQCGPVTLYDVMPTFHPAFLLRNRLGKPAAWRDLQAVMRHVGIPV